MNQDSGSFAPPSDGRTARSQRSRRKVVDALLELITKNSVMPTMEEVASCSGVSRRTVFRLFDDQQSLTMVAIQSAQSEILKRFGMPPLVGGSLQDRISVLVDYRSKLYEYTTPMRRIGELHKANIPLVEQSLRMARLNNRSHLEALLGEVIDADEYKKEELLHAAELMTSWHAWRTLRDDQLCSAEEAQSILLLSLNRLLCK